MTSTATSARSSAYSESASVKYVMETLPPFTNRLLLRWQTVGDGLRGVPQANPDGGSRVQTRPSAGLVCRFPPGAVPPNGHCRDGHPGRSDSAGQTGLACLEPRT